MRTGGFLAVGALMTGLVLGACGSSSSSSTTTTSPSTTAAPAVSTTTAVTSASSATNTAATCPTLAPANTALGATYGGPITTSTPGGGIVCEYTSGSGNAGVAIFAHSSAAVFAGQVAHATGNPAMPSLTGLGDGAYGATIGGRSVVNAYSNARRTVVAAQGPRALGPVEALARVALSDI